MSAVDAPSRDEDSRRWLDDLRVGDASADERLHALLLRAARFEVAKRGGTDEVARAAAAAARLVVRARLDDCDHRRRFTTWASKFALREAGVALRPR